MATTREQRMQSKKNRFIKTMLENGGYVERACRELKISRAAVTHWRDTDESFAVLMDTVKSLVIERLETEADRRAYEGVEEAVYYKGEVVGSKRMYSDNLLMFRLKGLKPEVYRDGPRAGDAVKLSDKELDDALQRRMSALNKSSKEEIVSEAVN